MTIAKIKLKIITLFASIMDIKTWDKLGNHNDSSLHMVMIIHKIKNMTSFSTSMMLSLVESNGLTTIVKIAEANWIDVKLMHLIQTFKLLSMTNDSAEMALLTIKLNVYSFDIELFFVPSYSSSKYLLSSMLFLLNLKKWMTISDTSIQINNKLKQDII